MSIEAALTTPKEETTPVDEKLIDRFSYAGIHFRQMPFELEGTTKQIVEKGLRIKRANCYFILDRTISDEVIYDGMDASDADIKSTQSRINITEFCNRLHESVVWTYQFLVDTREKKPGGNAPTKGLWHFTGVLIDRIIALEILRSSTAPEAYEHRGAGFLDMHIPLVGGEGILDEGGLYKKKSNTEPATKIIPKEAIIDIVRFGGYDTFDLVFAKIYTALTKYDEKVRPERLSRYCHKFNVEL